MTSRVRQMRRRAALGMFGKHRNYEQADAERLTLPASIEDGRIPGFAYTLLYWTISGIGFYLVMRGFGWSLPPIAGFLLMCVVVLGIMTVLVLVPVVWYARAVRRRMRRSSPGA